MISSKRAARKSVLSVTESYERQFVYPPIAMASEKTVTSLEWGSSAMTISLVVQGGVLSGPAEYLIDKSIDK